MRPNVMCLVALAMLATPLQAQSVFRSGVDLVHVAVTVVGEDGQPVSGLTADDFVIEEEGGQQGITYFSRGLESDLETMPLHLGVLFDTSGSMDREARFAKTAAIQVPPRAGLRSRYDAGQLRYRGAREPVRSG